MAFGDYLNDIELLRHSHLSFAVSNAHPALKELATQVIPSNEESGVTETIKKHFDWK
jgi:hydroxymethylpyrimidine pyrophosphatase-like HAD family hydrolase